MKYYQDCSEEIKATKAKLSDMLRDYNAEKDLFPGMSEPDWVVIVRALLLLFGTTEAMHDRMNRAGEK